MNCEPKNERYMPHKIEPPPPSLIIKPFAASYQRLVASCGVDICESASRSARRSSNNLDLIARELGMKRYY